LGKREKKNWGARGVPLGLQNQLSSAAIKKLKIWGTCCAPNDFTHFRRAMMVPNMYLVLKLDKGKVVSTAVEEAD